jgi:hypothetical protein
MADGPGEIVEVRYRPRSGEVCYLQCRLVQAVPGEEWVVEVEHRPLNGAPFTEPRRLAAEWRPEVYR